MGQITVAVNNRSYVVACEDGQEAHVQSLAGYLDRQAQEMARSVGQVGEGRLLLLSALVVADELSNVLKELDDLKSVVESQTQTQQMQQMATEERLQVLERRIQDLVAQLETS